MSAVADLQLADARRGAHRRPSLWDALWWELTKLAALTRTRVTFALCLLGPVLIYVHQSGYAVPLLILGFASQWCVCRC